MNKEFAEQFSDKPNYENPWPEARYLGTWFYQDCYVINDSLIVRSSDIESDYASMPYIGWNNYGPTETVGGLGGGRYIMDYYLDEETSHCSTKAMISALVYLGREYLDAKRRRN